MTDKGRNSGQPEPSHSAAASDAAAGSPWVVDVDVYLKSVGPPAKFELSTCLEKDPDNNLVFKNNHRPGFEIHFHLHDKTGKGYRFPEPQDLKYAVWSMKGEKCCPKSAKDDEGIFRPIRVDRDGMTLVVYNDNPDEEHGGPIRKFRYTLNVTNCGGDPYLPLDPGGDDQNGARSFLNF